jgi:predicted Zn-dependent protease with MMP-like domain
VGQVHLVRDTQEVAQQSLTHIPEEVVEELEPLVFLIQDLNQEQVGRDNLQILQVRHYLEQEGVVERQHLKVQ